MPSTEPLCRVEGLRLERGAFTLEVPELTVGRRSIVGLVGPNGAGKSSLLGAVDGTLSSVGGSIDLQGDALAHLDRAERARRVSHATALDTPAFEFSVLEIVLMGRYPHRARGWSGAFGLDGPDDEAIARRALDRCGLSELADRSIRALSAGERQRVELARALAQEAPLLLLDEPTSHLDLSHQVELAGIVRSVASEGGGALIALHDLSIAARLCDQLLLLDRGRVVGHGEPEATLTESRLSELYGTRVRVMREGERIWIGAAEL